MSAVEYLGTLRTQGVRIRVTTEGGVERLKVDAPSGTLRPRMVAAIRQMQDEILRTGYWWTEDDGIVVWWGRCARCGALIQGAGKGVQVPVGQEAVCVGPCRG